MLFLKKAEKIFESTRKLGGFTIMIIIEKIFLKHMNSCIVSVLRLRKNKLNIDKESPQDNGGAA